MLVTIVPHAVTLHITAPPSKSYLQRAIALALFSDQDCNLAGYQPSNDVDAALEVIKELGKTVVVDKTTLRISGAIKKARVLHVNMTESGLATRMFAPLFALLDFPKIVIDGEGSLLKRPVTAIVDLLSQLHCNVIATAGHLPITLSGGINLQSASLTLDASDSSQLLTGLLMALAITPQTARFEAPFELNVTNLVSKPYINITLQVMEQFGLYVSHTDLKTFYFSKPTLPKCADYDIEGDWSGGAFLLVAGAIAGQSCVSNLQINSHQSDRAILEVLQLCQAIVEHNSEGMVCRKSDLIAFTFDATDCPDLFPPLAALASQCKGVSIIKGTNRLIHKESNRALTIQNVCSQLGIEVVLFDNEMHVTGGTVTGGSVDSHNDHRIAMMAAVMGLVATNTVTIEHAEAVNKSYPNFYRDLGLMS